MKILHTADWHIGKQLHKHALEDEMALFFEWLISMIKKEKIELLLVSGDIFDIANPAAKDRKLYYQLLQILIEQKTRIVITGGNHDSIGVLNAPKDILDSLNITVIGGATENLADELVPIYNKQNQLELVVAAVPFLRDRDLRNRMTDGQFESRTKAIQQGIKDHYQNLGEIAKSKYPNVPIIAMGHLYMVGSKTSESERDIHVGNAAAVDQYVFNDYYDYVALGHIHRPQRIEQNDFIRYSGSPIALSFSEKTDNKVVLTFSCLNGKITTPEMVAIPKFREIQKFRGTLEKVKQQLENYKPDFPLQSFIELEIEEPDFSSNILAEVENLKQEYVNNSKFKILKGKTIFQNGVPDTGDLFTEGENIEDLKPIDVFQRKLGAESIGIDDQSSLKEAFQELLEMVEQIEE